MDNPIGIAISQQQQNKNILCLATAQALAGANSVVFYATGAIVGHRLAPYDTLSTLPITLFVTGMAACILPFGYLAKRRGRKAAFMAGTALGMLAGLTAALAVFIAAFELFCLAALMGGAYAAVSLSFRFAAADGVEPERRALALSLVMAGGVAAGVIGPSLIGGSLALWPSYPLVTAFIAQALAAVAAAQVLRRVVIPPVSAQTPSMYRSVRSIARQPGLMRTIFWAAVSYTVMNFLMTAAPLSMHMHGLSLNASTLGIQWHVIAMYAPGFITGRLINRFGAELIGTAGLAITLLAILTGFLGQEVMHYWLLLILLGIGWNLGFTGASANLLNYHRPEERMRVQSLNDFIIFSLMIVGSFLSGVLLNSAGWHAVLLGSLLLVSLALWVMLAGMLHHHRTG
ncbi:MFS transporter [Edwardsiella ictaluri]|uniref:MFS transporter n=1 Tax=Edwardsiella ictaluri TaxID=67780 RepID=UPI0037837398